MEVASGSPVEPKDFYNRQCRELMKERFSKAGMPYEQPKEESTE
jgi:hypothetical protein